MECDSSRKLANDLIGCVILSFQKKNHFLIYLMVQALAHLLIENFMGISLSQRENSSYLL
jgi:hypothetical protein